MRRLPILLLLIVIFSCRKEKESDHPIQPATYYTQDTTHIYAASMPYKFLAGSYWIYSDTNTLLTDSVRLQSTQYGYRETVTTNGTFQMEYHKQSYHNYRTNTSYSDYLWGVLVTRNNGVQDFFYYSQPICDNGTTPGQEVWG